MRTGSRLWLAVFGGGLSMLLLLSAAMTAAPAQAADALETDWVAAQANKARARLSAGSQGGQDFALVEIELAEGWKTYWRNPGDAGLPPEFDWSKSENLASAEPLYPAPFRFIDKAGETIGYKDRVTFPVKVARRDPQAAATLTVDVQYGVCKEICIPAEAAFTLTLPAGTLPEISGDILSEIPRDQADLKSGDPAIVRAEAIFTGADPRIEIVAKSQSGGSVSRIEAFLVAEGGVYVPSPEPGADAGGDVRLFIAKLGAGIDIEALKSRRIFVTVTSNSGASTADVKKTQ